MRNLEFNSPSQDVTRIYGKIQDFTAWKNITVLRWFIEPGNQTPLFIL